MFQWMKHPVLSTLGLLRGVTGNTSNQSFFYEEKYKDTSCNKHASLNHNDWIQTENTRSKVAALICQQPGADLSDVKRTQQVELELLKSPSVCESLSLRDCGGYSLLQLAIVNNQPTVVKYLISQGAEINAPVCGRPLHLAANLGHSEVVNLLIEYGADTKAMGCVCYPHSHPNSAKTVFNTDTECWTQICPGDMYNQANAKLVHFDFPLYFAIASDSVESVKFILKADGSNLNSDCSPLHVACKDGAYECVRYFINENRDTLNVLDSSGHTPLQYAIKWSKKFAEYLICNGASVMVKTPRNETLLHLLFKETRVISELKEIVRYLLDCGLHLSINAMDNDGNSALNLLLKLLYGSEIRSYLQSHGSLEDHNNHIYDQIYQCVVMLLKAKANPNICNKDGDRSLHILVHVGSTPFIVLHKLLSLLLKYHANANFSNKKDGTILSLLVFNGTRLRLGHSIRSLTHIKSSDVDLFINCIRLLHSHGCRFDSNRYTDVDCLLHLLFAHLDKLGHIVTMPVDLLNRTKLGSGSVRYIYQITQCLLECGCRPNECKLEQSDLNYVYFQLISKSSIVPFCQTHDLVLLLLQHGANANIGASHIALSVYHQQRHLYHQSVFPLLHLMNLWGSDECAYSRKQILVLFTIFLSAMDLTESRKCLLNYTQVDYYRGSKLKNQEVDDLDEYAHSILANPRPLKTLTAMMIYDNLGNKILKAKKLTLPKTLCDYLCSFQY